MAESNAKILASARAMELLRVQTADGRFLGHVFDLRCRWEPDAGGVPIIDQIVFGKTGFFERIGLRRVAPRSVHWYLVEAIRDNVIVVASSKR
jgi:hypothetical protein